MVSPYCPLSHVRPASATYHLNSDFSATCEDNDAHNADWACGFCHIGAAAADTRPANACLSATTPQFILLHHRFLDQNALSGVTFRHCSRSYSTAGVIGARLRNSRIGFMNHQIYVGPVPADRQCCASARISNGSVITNVVNSCAPGTRSEILRACRSNQQKQRFFV